MGHGKLKKFAENETFRCLLQPDASAVLAKPAGSKALVLRDHPVKGRWNAEMFAAPQPIVLELGCGKGDYTIALARRHPHWNCLGVDIKGARLWKGAKYATENALPNVAFLRTRIEFIEAFFAPGEVSEIWLTFSDPQLHSENSRLTSPLFLERYRKFLAPGGIVHLKTDSRFLHEYTRSVIRANNLDVLACSTDIYHDSQFGSDMRLEEGVPSEISGHPRPLFEGGSAPLLSPCGSRPISPPSSDTASAGRSDERRDPRSVRGRSEAETVSEGIPSGNRDIAISKVIDTEIVTGVQTFYEGMFLEMGLPITYVAFRIDKEGAYVHPADFDEKYWREQEGPRRTFSHQPAKKQGAPDGHRPDDGRG